MKSFSIKIHNEIFQKQIIACILIIINYALAETYFINGVQTRN